MSTIVKNTNARLRTVRWIRRFDRDGRVEAKTAKEAGQECRRKDELEHKHRCTRAWQLIVEIERMDRESPEWWPLPSSHMRRMTSLQQYTILPQSMAGRMATALEILARRSSSTREAVGPAYATLMPCLNEGEKHELAERRMVVWYQSTKALLPARAANSALDARPLLHTEATYDTCPVCLDTKTVYASWKCKHGVCISCSLRMKEYETSCTRSRCPCCRARRATASYFKFEECLGLNTIRATRW